MDNISVTVAMPAFNVAKFIVESVESVLSQEFDSFELIIIDDGSSDGTPEKLKRYASDPRIRIERNSANHGSGISRNLILELARGECLLPCDADDMLLPGALERLSCCLHDNPDFGVVYGDILCLDTEGDRLCEKPSIVGQDASQVWDLFENAVNHGGSMMRTDLLRKVGGYAVGRVPDDWGLFLKMVEITKIHYLNGHVYYLWRRHPDSQSRRGINREALAHMIRETVERRKKRADLC